jgi:hypothetical protein
MYLSYKYSRNLNHERKVFNLPGNNQILLKLIGVANYMEESLSGLKTVYSVVIALSVTEAIKSIFDIEVYKNTYGINLELLPAFIIFIITLIPFYQGANKYLSEIQKDKNHKASFERIIDFTFFFLESLLFYWIALLINEKILFFKIMTVLLLLDILWLLSVLCYNKDLFNKIKWWCKLNFILVILLLFLFYMNYYNINVLLLIFIIRTSCDYFCTWKFYWD